MVGPLALFCARGIEISCAFKRASGLRVAAARNVTNDGTLTNETTSREGNVMAETVIVTPAAGVIDESNRSAVSWPAILAGSITAAALSLLLLAFGSGLGLSVVSPWSDRGISSSTASIAAGIYLIIVAVMFSALT